VVPYLLLKSDLGRYYGTVIDYYDAVEDFSNYSEHNHKTLPKNIVACLAHLRTVTIPSDMQYHLSRFREHSKDWIISELEKLNVTAAKLREVTGSGTMLSTVIDLHSNPKRARLFNQKTDLRKTVEALIERKAKEEETQNTVANTENFSSEALGGGRGAATVSSVRRSVLFVDAVADEGVELKTVTPTL